jgi:hypothetical protein
MGNSNGSIFKYLFPLVLAGVVFYLVFTNMGKERAIPGIPEPKQEKVTGGITKEIDGYTVKIDYLYSYDIKALVVSAKGYDGSRLGDQLSPKDLALAWGAVAEKNKDINFHWRQSSRRYYWQLNSDAEVRKIGNLETISLCSANTHLIPADDTVRKLVKRIKKGDYVRIKGYLVNVDAKKGDGSTFWWNSSTTREDTGDGSCELVYVTQIQKLD